jgi:hypothetical protein
VGDHIPAKTTTLQSFFGFPVIFGRVNCPPSLSFRLVTEPLEVIAISYCGRFFHSTQSKFTISFHLVKHGFAVAFERSDRISKLDVHGSLHSIRVLLHQLKQFPTSVSLDASVFRI